MTPEWPLNSCYIGIFLIFLLDLPRISMFLLNTLIRLCVPQYSLSSVGDISKYDILCLPNMLLRVKTCSPS